MPVERRKRRPHVYPRHHHTADQLDGPPPRALLVHQIRQRRPPVQAESVHVPRMAPVRFPRRPTTVLRNAAPLLHTPALEQPRSKTIRHRKPRPILEIVQVAPVLYAHPAAFSLLSTVHDPPERALDLLHSRIRLAPKMKLVERATMCLKLGQRVPPVSEGETKPGVVRPTTTKFGCRLHPHGEPEKVLVDAIDPRPERQRRGIPGGRRHDARDARRRGLGGDLLDILQRTQRELLLGRVERGHPTGPSKGDQVGRGLGWRGAVVDGQDPDGWIYVVYLMSRVGLCGLFDVKDHDICILYPTCARPSPQFAFHPPLPIADIFF